MTKAAPQPILDPVKADEALQAAANILEQHSIKYWIRSGTLLSAVRDGGFNVYDHDIDLLCERDGVDIPGLINAFEASFRLVLPNTGVVRQILARHGNGTLVDLKLADIEQGWLWYPVWRGDGRDEEVPRVHIYPYALFTGAFSELKLGEGVYPAPGDTEEYLRYHYGDNWSQFKTKAKDVDMTDMTWDYIYSPPHSKSLGELYRMLHPQAQDKLVIYVCGHGETTDVTVQALECLRREADFKYEVRYAGPDALIARSRCIAATKFLDDKDAGYLLFLDSDIVFKPGDVKQVLNSLKEGYPVVAGAYPVASGDFLAVKSFSGTSTFFDGELKRFQYVSTGFMGISRSALETIRDKLELPRLHRAQWCELHPFFESKGLPEEGIYISEDWDFCNKVRDAGLDIFLHSDVLLYHVKQQVLSPQDAIDKDAAVDPGKEFNLVKKHLFADLVQYTGLPLREAEAKLATAATEIQAAFTSHSSNRVCVEDFYRDNYLSLFDLTDFNSQGGYYTLRLQALSKIRNKRILDVGCGIGTAALWLGLLGNYVIGYDINSKAVEFAEFRRKKFNIRSVEFLTELPDLRNCDMVIALDVLEHIENLEEWLADLGGRMKRGTIFYHHDSWGGNLQHYDNSKFIDGYLEQAGLLKFDALWAIKE